MRDGLLLEMHAPVRSSALVVVDMQNDFCHPSGALGRAGVDLSSIPAAHEAIVKLHQGAHRVGVPVVFVRTVCRPETDSDAWLERREYATEVCRPDTSGIDFYGLEPEADDIVVTKHRYTPFVGSAFESILRTLGTQSLILTGTATNVCVESIARDAYARDYRVVVVEDATAAATTGIHQASLATLRQHFGLVVPAEDITAQWDLSAHLRSGLSVTH